MSRHSAFLFCACLLLGCPVVCNAQIAKPPPPEKWKDFELVLGQESASKFDYILDLGQFGDRAAINMPSPGLDPVFSTGASCKELDGFTPQTPNVADAAEQASGIQLREINLTIRHKGSESETLYLLSSGVRISAKFVPEEPLDPSLGQFAHFGPTDERSLRVRFKLGSLAWQGLNVMVFVNADGIPIFSITVKYSVFPQTIVLDALSGSLPSAPGTGFSPTKDGVGYIVSVGAAPVPYSPWKACYKLTGQRECGAYSVCSWQNFDDSDLSFQFQLQGEDPGKRVYAMGMLEALYRIRESPPHLR